MAKKFSQMTTKKLNALLETANDEDRAQIEAVLAAREQVAANPEDLSNTPVGGVDGTTDVTVGDELTPEEEAALKAAEANGGINPGYAEKAHAKKMTNEELDALVKELSVNINHRCQVVPFNTIDWVDGYIAGIMKEKRANKALYAIKLDNGKRIVKAYDSNLLRILDETVTVVERKRAPRKAKTDAEELPWTADDVNNEISKYIENVGKFVTFSIFGQAEHEEPVTGRILGITPDKRVKALLYRIEIPAPTEANPDAVKTVHKVVTASLTIDPEYDETGAEMNAKYRERRDNIVNRVPMTPQDRVMLCRENLEKAQAAIEKAQTNYEAKLKLLKEAEAELEKTLNGGVPASEPEVSEAQAEIPDELS